MVTVQLLTCNVITGPEGHEMTSLVYFSVEEYATSFTDRRAMECAELLFVDIVG
jgi:hypothetical protein